MKLKTSAENINTSACHQWPVRVYYEDTDSGGIVYHANHLRFFERGRTEWFRALGFELDKLMAEGIMFVVSHLDVDYMHAAYFNDALLVLSEMTQIRKASIIFKQKICLAKSRQAIICRARVTIACVDPQGLKVTKIPPTLSQQLQQASYSRSDS